MNELQKLANGKCFNCGYKFEGHTHIINVKAAQHGTICICFNCGEVHLLKNGVLEVIDIKNLPVEVQEIIEAAIAALQMVKK